MIRDGVQLVFDDGGERQRPAALLVHGWAMDRMSLTPLSDALQGSHRVVSIDLRGFGESDAPEQSYTIPGYSDDVTRLARQLGLEQPIVIGHSMGGMIALDIAARYPDEISAAIVLEGLVVPAEGIHPGVSAMLPRVLADDYPDFVRQLIAHLAGPHFDPAGRSRLMALAASCRQHVLVSALRWILAFEHRSRGSRRWSLALCWNEHGSFRPRSISAALSRARCRATRRLWPLLPLEVPDQLNAMVARFIRTNVSLG
jgi:pimeloyl-ACP methyl ester carboxylesterase